MTVTSTDVEADKHYLDPLVSDAEGVPAPDPVLGLAAGLVVAAHRAHGVRPLDTGPAHNIRGVSRHQPSLTSVHPANIKMVNAYLLIMTQNVKNTINKLRKSSSITFIEQYNVVVVVVNVLFL